MLLARITNARILGFSFFASLAPLRSNFLAVCSFIQSTEMFFPTLACKSALSCFFKCKHTPPHLNYLTIFSFFASFAPLRSKPNEHFQPNPSFASLAPLRSNFLAICLFIQSTFLLVISYVVGTDYKSALSWLFLLCVPCALAVQLFSDLVVLSKVLFYWS